jgi:hypothetical protein
MPKKDERVNLRLAQQDKERFETAAEKMRLSLSAWLTLAGLEKLERDSAESRDGKPRKGKTVGR